MSEISRLQPTDRTRAVKVGRLAGGGGVKVAGDVITTSEVISEAFKKLFE